MRIHLAGIVAAAVFSVGPLAAQDAADLFSKLDVNKDGYVTPDEVQESQKALYERMLRNADKDGDKKLSREEFVAGLQPDETPKTPLAGGQAFGPPGGKAKGDPRQFFERLDANKDGKLSKDELPEQMRERFAQMDGNGDGFVSPEEFARGAMAYGKRPPGAPATPASTTPQTAGQPRPNPAGAPNRQELEALFDRTDANSDGKLTKDEIPEDRRGMRAILERTGDSITKEQFMRGMLAMMQGDAGQPPRPESAAPRRPDGPPGAPPPGGPGGGLFGALDTDRNGELSTQEIVAAGTALLKLDRNGDGKLTPDEVFGGPPGGGPPGRPGEGRPGEGRPGAGQPGNPPPGAPGAGRPGQRGLGGLNPEEFRERLKQADANGDGKISKDEAPAMIKDRFDRIDQNGDGFVDAAEIAEMLRRMAADGGGKAKARPNNDNK
ncbi:MAG: EF-hand domain-containing protein [Planctomycetia bacterium]|jgi:Ca2+-binding EF-hand superfamily protein|nr:EF-hand domain-containing protein [Planctomycetia bacterium]